MKLEKDFERSLIITLTPRDVEIPFVEKPMLYFLSKINLSEEQRKNIQEKEDEIKNLCIKLIEQYGEDDAKNFLCFALMEVLKQPSHYVINNDYCIELATGEESSYYNYEEIYKIFSSKELFYAFEFIDETEEKYFAYAKNDMFFVKDSINTKENDFLKNKTLLDLNNKMKKLLEVPSEDNFVICFNELKYDFKNNKFIIILKHNFSEKGIIREDKSFILNKEGLTNFLEDEFFEYYVNEYHQLFIFISVLMMCNEFISSRMFFETPELFKKIIKKRIFLLEDYYNNNKANINLIKETFTEQDYIDNKEEVIETFGHDFWVNKMITGEKAFLKEFNQMVEQARKEKNNKKKNKR